MKYTRLMTLLLFLLIILSLSFPAAAQSTESDNKAVAVDNMIASGGETSFRILIKNDDTQLHKYTLSYGVLPKEFQADFSLNGKVIGQLEVKTGESTVATLNVKASELASAGTTVIGIEAGRDDGRKYFLTVSVTVNHDYSLMITNRMKGLNVISGQDLSFDVSVLNNGSKKLDNIMLSLDLPYKWIQQGTNPERLSLKPGENGLYKVKISVPLSQVSGNNKMKVSAVSGDTTSSKVEIPVTVQNNPSYLIWIIGIIAVAGLGTLLYFRKHGRR